MKTGTIKVDYLARVEGEGALHLLRDPFPAAPNRARIEMSQSHPLIIGIGNEYRGDDAVGLIVARRLKERLADSAFGVAEAIELARALARLPRNLIVYGIEGKSFAAGVGLSSEVEKVAGEVARQLLTEANL